MHEKKQVRIVLSENIANLIDRHRDTDPDSYMTYRVEFNAMISRLRALADDKYDELYFEQTQVPSYSHRSNHTFKLYGVRTETDYEFQERLKKEQESIERSIGWDEESLAELRQELSDLEKGIHNKKLDIKIKEKKLQQHLVNLS